ncbi:acyl-CoA thioesterase [Coxiella-like endosymbiont]|uniref:acyl-CoA thioesterase n=1 Tax=Coxiella-like endosymbiont TaxID=1592897 RepID=UPI0034E26121
MVNNTNYFHYFDHARIKFLLSKGIDSSEWRKKGFDLVLIHVDMAIKASLRAYDKFHVILTAELLKKLRILFHQKIFYTSGGKADSRSKKHSCLISNKTFPPTRFLKN